MGQMLGCEDRTGSLRYVSIEITHCDIRVLDLDRLAVVRCRSRNWGKPGEEVYIEVVEFKVGSRTETEEPVTIFKRGNIIDQRDRDDVTDSCLAAVKEISRHKRLREKWLERHPEEIEMFPPPQALVVQDTSNKCGDDR